MDRRCLAVLMAALLQPVAARADLRDALAALVGHPKADLIRRFGQPGETVTTVDGERLLYETLDAGFVGAGSGLNTRAGGPSDVGPWPRAYSFPCRTEVVVRDGLVQAFNRRGTGCR